MEHRKGFRFPIFWKILGSCLALAGLLIGLSYAYAHYRQSQLEGRGSSAKTDRPGTASHRADDRVIRWPFNGAVMVKKGIRHGGQMVFYGARISEDRLAADVCRGRNNGDVQFIQKQVMKGAIREHQAQLGGLFCDVGCDRSIGAAFHQHNGTRRVQQSC